MKAVLVVLMFALCADVSCYAENTLPLQDGVQQIADSSGVSVPAAASDAVGTADVERMIAYLENRNRELEGMRQQFFSYYMWFMATLLIAMAVLILLNIRESKRKDKIIANSEQLLRHSMLVQEAERKRISLDLHDSVLQGMRCVSRMAENLSDKEAAREIIDMQTENIESIRKLCYNLTPPAINKGNLIPSLDFLGQKIFDTASTGFQFRVVCEQGVDFGRWGEDALMNLYRLVQEALQNIRKHAEAGEATVFFKNCGQDSFKVIITDDGRGMDLDLVARINDASFEQLEGLHFGLRNIFERAKLLGGKVTYVSEEDCGTRLTVEL